jgi:hypothetical protein
MPAAISFNVPEKLWDQFRSQAARLDLLYSGFLGNVLERELPSLRQELAGLKLSTRAKRHIAGAVKRTGTKSVNIEVTQETADALRAALAEHNLVRDAVMSRLVLFLRSSDALLKELEVPRTLGRNRADGCLEDMPLSPMRAMEAVRDDPFFYLRHHIEAQWGCGLYRVNVAGLDWAACYLPDDEVPGTAAHRRNSKLFAKLFEDTPLRNGKKTAAKAARRTV